MQKAEYRNRKKGMETGRTKEEEPGSRKAEAAPKEPPTGENGKKGKERRKAK